MIASNEILENSFVFDYLTERGIDQNLAERCGLKYVSKIEAKKLTGHNIGGLLIPYHSPKKEIWTYRLRPLPDDWETSPKLKQEYIERNGKLPKFLSKKGDRNKPYLSPLLNWEKILNKASEDIIITEGEIKGLNACNHGIATIALSGVHNFVTANDEGISEFLPELNSIQWQGRYVGICFDSDIISNLAVQHAALKLCNELVQRKANPYIVVLPRELNGDKNGVDDFIQRHGVKALKEIIHWYKIWQSTGDPRTKILQWDKESQKYSLNKFEPITSIKGLMAWSILKEKWKYRPNFGWCEWNGKYWEIPNDGKNGENTLIQEVKHFCCKQNWLNNHNHNSIFEEVSVKLFDHKIKWNPTHVLGFNNGYLNTETSEFLPFNKDFCVTSILPFDYNPTASAKEWENYLNFTFNGDQNKIQYIRAWMRWILTPKDNFDYPIEATLWIVGKPGLGKGTFLSVLHALCGKDNIGIFDPADINNANKLFSLVDKKLAFNNDVDGFIPNIPLYNSICSNETVNVKHLYHDIFPTRLNTVTVLAMNKEVGFKGAGSEGLKRRLHVVRFDREPEKRDTDLKAKLREELSGIFSWVWGLSFAQTKKILKWRITEDVSEVFELNHPEIEFLKQTYPDGESFKKSSTLYNEYREWCQENGYESGKMKSFAYLLKQIKGVKKMEHRDANYYFIPEMKDYIEISQEDNTPPTSFVEGVEDCGGYSVEGSNLDTVSSVEGVEGCEQNFFLKEKNNLKVELNSEKILQPSTLQSESDLQPSTETSTETSTENETLIISLTDDQKKVTESWDQDLKNLLVTNLDELQLLKEIYGLIKNELQRLRKNKEASKIMFTSRYGHSPKEATYFELLDYCQYLRRQNPDSDRTKDNDPKPSPKPSAPVKKPSAPKKPSNVRNFVKKPDQPEFNLSDVLPHLEQGTGKHKRNYVCPCCEKDYLSANPSKGYKCFNPETNCDAKDIFKEFIKILKENDPQWRQWNQDMTDWVDQVNQNP